MRWFLALAIALLAPTAVALDVLPTEAHLGATEARILVRAENASVRVEADPPALAAVAAPDDANASAFAPTPRVLAADHVWHGLDRIAVIVLHRADAQAGTIVTISDAANAGVEFEWPAVHRSLPAAPLASILGVAGVVAIASRRS